jgi:hypothetical protein
MGVEPSTSGEFTRKIPFFLSVQCPMPGRVNLAGDEMDESRDS